MNYCISCGVLLKPNQLKFCSYEHYIMYHNTKRSNPDLSDKELANLIYKKIDDRKDNCNYCGIPLKKIHAHANYCDRNCHRMYKHYSQKGYSEEKIKQIGKKKKHKCNACGVIISKETIEKHGHFCSKEHEIYYKQKRNEGMAIRDIKNSLK